MVNIKNALLFISTSVIFLSGCQKIAPGITTTVRGTLTDYNQHIPIQNAKLEVDELKHGLYGDSFIGVVGTALTGIDGKYTLTFTTTGKGSYYKIYTRLNSNYFDTNLPMLVTVGKDTTGQTH